MSSVSHEPNHTRATVISREVCARGIAMATVNAIFTLVDICRKNWKRIFFEKFWQENCLTWLLWTFHLLPLSKSKLCHGRFCKWQTSPHGLGVHGLGAVCSIEIDCGSVRHFQNGVPAHNQFLCWWWACQPFTKSSIEWCIKRLESYCIHWELRSELKTTCIYTSLKAGVCFCFMTYLCTLGRLLHSNHDDSDTGRIHVCWHKLLFPAHRSYAVQCCIRRCLTRL